MLSTLDISIIAFYFIIVFGIAIWSKKTETKSEDYFLAGRNLGWFVIGSSLFASNIGSEHLIGLAGSGASSGMAVAHFEVLAAFALLLLGWFFVPFYLKSNVVTMPEFLELRFSKNARLYLSVISVVSYVLTKISVTIYAGATVFETIGVPFWIGAFIVVFATGIYTVFGGLRAVLYTDMVQMFIMLGGSALVVIVGLNAVGGTNEVVRLVEPEFFNMWKSIDHPEFPWTGIIFGAPILGVWYWCTDQFIVQRVLSAKNISEARRGAMFGGFLKLTPPFIFVIPGIICFALVQKGLLTLERPDMALPSMISQLLPSGIKGMVVAGLLAALMSSLSSVFNSCSTLITYDFYKRLNPHTSEKKLILVGQVSTAILVLTGMAWIPMMNLISGQLFNYIQSVQAYISPPIASVFLLGILFKRLNHHGAMASLWSGFVLGIARLMGEIFKNNLAADGLVYKIVTMNFLHFAVLLFVICSIILVVVSLMTSKPVNKNLDLLTWSSKGLKWTKTETKDFYLSLLLVMCVLFIWIWYS